MTAALEEIKSIDIEEWLTLNTAASSTKLIQGQTPDMKNVWTDEKPGSIITAPGYIKVGQVPSGNPCSFCINYFKTSSGTQTFVVSDNSTVWTTVDFQNFTAIITGLSSVFQLRGIVVRDKLWLTNGSDSVRVFDGSTVTVLDGTGGTPDVPKGKYIAYHDERVWIYHVSSKRSAAYFSSLTDSSGSIIAPDASGAWDTTDNFLQISEGDADFGTGMLLYRGYLHFFKQYSIWRLVGYDEYTYSRVKTRSSTGTRFNESIQELDSLVHFIGIDGIYVFDGEEADRISDLIDPATASQTAFGFNQLQQPNQNNQFWEVASSADWNAGTVLTNQDIDNQLALAAADDTQADFQAGPTQTNIDLVTNPGYVQLSYTGNTGSKSNANIALNVPSALVPTSGFSTIGSASFINNGSNSNAVGFSLSSFGPSGYFEITLPVNYPISFLTFKNWNNSSGFKIQVFIDGNVVTLDSVVDPLGYAAIVGNYLIDNKIPPVTRDITLGIVATSGKVIHVVVTGGSSIGQTFTVTEIIVNATDFNASGKFVSKTLDLKDTPASALRFCASSTVPVGTIQFYTQTSADGVTWDAEIFAANGGSDAHSGNPVGSTPKRYIRWVAYFTSDGSDTPTIDAVWLGSIYESAVHDTGGGIFSWGAFESDYSLNGQEIYFYYRGATSSAGVSAASWNPIVPGGVLSFSTAFRYVQFKIEFTRHNMDSNPPIIDSVTINWITGSATQSQVLQNVASVYWRNRYWLSAAGPSATANDTILVRGKKTFKNPWMLKDWGILSFTRFQDSLYGCSSSDGSIYKLDTGYSKAGSAMDSYFETGDFVFNGFTANLIEIDVEVERSGAWSLTVGVSVDNGNTWTEKTVDLTESTFDDNYLKRLNFNLTTTRFRIRFRTNGVDTPFQVHRCIAYYKLESERGSIRGDYRAA